MPVSGHAAPADLQHAWREARLWTDDTIGRRLSEAVARSRHVAVRIYSKERPYEGTYGDVFERALAFASALTARGIRPGDRVVFQLPNWVDAAVVAWGCAFGGFAAVPVVHIYGDVELAHVLADTRARVLVVPEAFGKRDHLASLRAHLAATPSVEVAVVAGERAVAGAVTLTELIARAPAGFRPAHVDPDDIAVIGYTSGSTAAPKGVLHSHRTWLASLAHYGAYSPPSRHLPELGASPVSHVAGMVHLMAPIATQDPIHLTDRWSAGMVLKLLRAADLSMRGGVSFFLDDLLGNADLRDTDLRHLRWISLGGAPIPTRLVEQAEDRGMTVIRGYGCTEQFGIAAGTWSDPVGARLHTEGRPMAGSQVRIVDDTGAAVPAGTRGHIHSRGPDLAIGYSDPQQTREAFLPDGWFRTGDLGILDADGRLTVAGRNKDIIIRGGENISALEVENALLALPGIIEAAVVAAPDERMGERVCAFVRSDNGSRPSLTEVRDALTHRGLTRQKQPEELHHVEHFPRTATGKIDKLSLAAR